MENINILREKKSELLKKLKEINNKIKEYEKKRKKIIIPNDYVPINGFNNKYYINKNGSIFSTNTNKLMQSCLTQVNGYPMVCLYKNGSHRNYLVHRLVAETFIPNPNNYKEVNHKDFDRLNCSVENLEWCSRKYNLEYSINAGRIKNGFVKKKIKQLDNDGKLIKIWDSCQDASRTLHCDKSDISKCCKGKKNSCKGFRWEYV